MIFYPGPSMPSEFSFILRRIRIAYQEYKKKDILFRSLTSKSVLKSITGSNLKTTAFYFKSQAS